ncbi:MAG: NADH-quinone oxidoreductase subunit J [Cyclobacteriaceae bacterium]|nr:NADH-quinone oxidoreductase subunit J [Cyclobacteriaceae bacterium]
MMEQAVLYILAGVAAASAIAIVFVRHVFYAALMLLACLLALAGIYGIMQAGFLAITQVLIYAGGVLVLIVFAIVVTNRVAGKSLQVESQHRFAGFLIAAAIARVLAWGYHQTEFLVNNHSQIGKELKPLGETLFTSYAAPFEIGGVLLLVCLVGAAFTASSFKKSAHD